MRRLRKLVTSLPCRRVRRPPHHPAQLQRAGLRTARKSTWNPRRPTLHRILDLKLQGGASEKETTRWSKGGHGLPSDYRKSTASLVGNGEPGRPPTRIHGAAGTHLPALGVRGSMDQKNGHMGNLHTSADHLQAVGGRAKQAPPLHKARERKAKLRIPAQGSSGENTPAGVGKPQDRCRLQGNYTARIRTGVLQGQPIKEEA